MDFLMMVSVANRVWGLVSLPRLKEFIRPSLGYRHFEEHQHSLLE